MHLNILKSISNKIFIQIFFSKKEPSIFKIGKNLSFFFEKFQFPSFATLDSLIDHQYMKIIPSSLRGIMKNLKKKSPFMMLLFV